ncbi:hypothetical protein BC827DRAFT_128544 [Russula dissimulans]|nr:hypothetical protein BC827DRAFT_128544 [Russula dissimulans]
MVPYHFTMHTNENPVSMSVSRNQRHFSPYPSPYIQGVSRMAVHSNYSEPSMTLPQACRNSAPGFVNYDGLSDIGSVLSIDPSTPIDEPPPPYPTNSMLVKPLSDIFSQSTLLLPERLPNIGSITPSPLAPVPQRHSSLYQVLKHESQASPAQGTVSSTVSSIAHTLELPEQQARLAPPPSTPALGNRRRPTIASGASETSLSANQIASTSLAAMAVVDTCMGVPKLPTLPAGPAAQVQVRSPVPSTNITLHSNDAGAKWVCCHNALTRSHAASGKPSRASEG